MKFCKKPVVIEAITFDEFVAHGATVDPAGAAMHGGYSWHFEYQGHPITHENDNCYLIPTLEGVMRFDRGDMLITGVKGEIYPCKLDIFALTYEPAEQTYLQQDQGLEPVEYFELDDVAKLTEAERLGVFGYDPITNGSDKA